MGQKSETKKPLETRFAIFSSSRVCGLFMSFLFLIPNSVSLSVKGLRSQHVRLELRLNRL